MLPEHNLVGIGTSRPDRIIRLAWTFHHDLNCLACQLLIDFQADAVLQLHQPVQPLMLAAVIHLIFHLRRRGAGTPGVNKGICLVIAYLSQKLHQLLEILLGFPRKAYNQVCSQAGLRHSRPDFPHQLPIALHRIYPVHGLENPVAAVLHRQMEMLADMAAVLDDLNHLVT